MKVGVRGLYAFLLVGGALILMYEMAQVRKGRFVTVEIAQNNISVVLPGVNSSSSDLPQSVLRDTHMTDSVVSEHLHSNVTISNHHLHTASGGQHTQPIPGTGAPSNSVKQRRLVLILSYQRCGSSFFGGLFDRDPGGLYMYEPLDGLYGAMYGTQEGWNVPSDIMNWPNGTQRVLPVEESSAVSNFLHDLLTCRYDRLPTEFLLHKYWAQFKRFEAHMAPFTKCLGRTGLYSAHAKCDKPMRGLCSSRFNKDIKKQSMCHDSLWNATSGTRISKDNSLMAQYSSCMKEQRIKAAGCIRTLKLVCDAARLRSTKTVRATMDSVEMLLETLPNLRILHLIRDPRAVVLSRKNFHSSGQSLYAKGDTNKESKLFCQNLVRDINIRHTLEEKYPGRIMEVLYDRFVKDPLNQTELIYNFLDVPLSQAVKDWVITNTRSKPSTDSATNSTISKQPINTGKRKTTSKILKKKPQSKLSIIETININKNCRQLLDMVDYNWDAR